ncbi:MAG: AMP-binding protein [Burkholderiales bacterium]|nr:AMP-binding protein [Burkholderiales bacterium]
MNPLDLAEYNGSIGLPLPSTEIRRARRRGPGPAARPAGRRSASAARRVMAGYWQRPEEPAAALGADGFLRTGDIGTMDEKGFVRVVDRKKDMILVSGFDVYPRTGIEQVVAMRPGRARGGAAVGAPMPSGRAPSEAAFVVKKDPNLTAEQLLEFCKAQLTGCKRPKYVEFRPRTPEDQTSARIRRSARCASRRPGRRRRRDPPWAPAIAARCASRSRRPRTSKSSNATARSARAPVTCT